MSLIRNPLCAFALTLVAAGPRAGLAQTVNPNLWVTNGDVYAVASHEGTVYIGGTFSRVGPVTGPAAPIDATSGALPASFPKVSGELFVVIPDGAFGETHCRGGRLLERLAKAGHAGIQVFRRVYGFIDKPKR